MPKSSEAGGAVDRVILLFLLALLLLVSPLLAVWAADDAAWYLPYAIWGGIVALAAWLQRHLPPDEL